MTTSYSYVLLQAVPDPRRGERVNVGVVVLKPDGLDIEVHESRKLRALTGESWGAYITAFESLLRDTDRPDLALDERVGRFRLIENQFVTSKPGWFEAADAPAYDAMLRQIVKNLISRPTRKRTKEEQTVVAEITSALRTAEVLAAKEEPLESGKVVRGYEVEAGLEADFVQLNSQFHVAAVLDLRADNPRISQAALKAIVLDRARANWEPKTKVHRIGVIAAPKARLSELRENVRLIEEYSDEVLNWTDRAHRAKLKRIFFDAYNAHRDATSN
jgi:hypothetical protein